MTQKLYEKFSTVLFSNGIYQGFLQNNLRHGLGVYIWDSGEIYFGEWEKDNLQGEGYFFQSNGAFIHAFFLNNKAHGPGILKLSDSDVVLGYWNNGNLNDLAFKYFQKEDEWFLCEFQENHFSQCISKGKSFPGLPNIDLANKFKDLSDMNEIIEKSNEMIKKLSDSSPFEFIYKNFDDGGVYLGLTKEKIPHGYGVFKFSDDKMHIGLYQNGILEGPCFIQFQNGDYYCGELKKGKFDGISLFYQKNKDLWLHAEYRAGVQQKVLNKSTKSNNESTEISRLSFKKNAEFALKIFTPNNLFTSPIFPSLSDLINHYSKDWGLSPIKTGKKAFGEENCRNINIYEMILNEQPQTIKLSTHRTNGDSINEDCQSNNPKHTESQNFLSDLSQREQLDDPKELSFNKEGFHKEENNYKESIFSKQKSPSTDKNLNFMTEPDEKKMNMNEFEQKNNKKFQENVLITDKIANSKCITEPNDMNQLEQKINQENVLLTNKIDNLKCLTKPIEQMEDKIVQFNRKSDEETEKINIETIRVIQNKIQEENKKNEKLENFSNDIKTIMKKVQKTVEQVEEEKINEKKQKIKTEIKKEQNNQEKKNNSQTPKVHQTKTNTTASIYPSVLENTQKNYFDFDKNSIKNPIDSRKFSLDSDKNPKKLSLSSIQEIIKKDDKCDNERKNEAIKMNDKLNDLFEKNQKCYDQNSFNKNKNKNIIECDRSENDKTTEISQYKIGSTRELLKNQIKEEEGNAEFSLPQQIKNDKQMNFIQENNITRVKTKKNQPEKQETSNQNRNKTAEKNKTNFENVFQYDLNDNNENFFPHQEKKKDDRTFDNDQKTTEKKQLKFYEPDKDTKSLNVNENNQNNFQSLIGKTPQKLKNSSVLNQINELNNDIDLKIKNIHENRKNKTYNRLNCSTEEINEYYDSLEKCYKELGVEKNELLDLITQRFKEELDQKFPQFSNVPGFLFQKFSLPMKILNNNAEIPLFVRIPLN